MTVHPNVKEQDRLTPDLPEFPTENQSVLQMLKEPTFGDYKMNETQAIVTPDLQAAPIVLRSMSP